MTTTKEVREIRPPSNVEETPEGARLTIEMPGVAKETLSVTVEDDILTIRGERVDPLAEYRVLHRESRTGPRSRSFRLSRDLSRDGIGADYRDGVLTLTVPRAEHTIPRKIEIETN